MDNLDDKKVISFNGGNREIFEEWMINGGVHHWDFNGCIDSFCGFDVDVFIKFFDISVQHTPLIIDGF